MSLSAHSMRIATSKDASDFELLFVSLFSSPFSLFATTFVASVCGQDTRNVDPQSAHNLQVARPGSSTSVLRTKVTKRAASPLLGRCKINFRSTMGFQMLSLNPRCFSLNA